MEDALRRIADHNRVGRCSLLVLWVSIDAVNTMTAISEDRLEALKALVFGLSDELAHCLVSLSAAWSWFDPLSRLVRFK